MNPQLPSFESLTAGISDSGRDTVICHFKLCRDTVYLRGHFPQAPILPGVTQLDWAIHLAAKYLGTPDNVQTIEALKFNDMILPEATVTLTLERKHKNCVLFRYHHHESPFSSGRLVYGQGDL